MSDPVQDGAVESAREPVPRRLYALHSRVRPRSPWLAIHATDGETKALRSRGPQGYRAIKDRWCLDPALSREGLPCGVECTALKMGEGGALTPATQTVSLWT